MNNYLRNNTNIKEGDTVIVDGVDQIFDSSGYHIYIDKLGFFGNNKEVTISDIGNDDSGEYIELTPPEQHFVIFVSLYRYNLSLLGSPKPLTQLNINNYNSCILGKDIDDAPYIDNWSVMNGIIDGDGFMRYSWSNVDILSLYNQPLKIVNSKGIYVKVKDDQNKEYIFPHWFLYPPHRPSAKDMYKPKNIKRFLNF